MMQPSSSSPYQDSPPPREKRISFVIIYGVFRTLAAFVNMLTSRFLAAVLDGHLKEEGGLGLRTSSIPLRYL